MDEQYQQLGRELPALQAAVDSMRVRPLSSSRILSDARKLHGRWPELSAEEKRQFAESIVERITVGEKEISFVLNYTPDKETATK